MMNVDFINPNIPLLDLHRHLEGSVRLETILDLGKQHNLPLPAWDAQSLRPHIQVVTPQPGVMQFIAKFEWMVGILVDYEACRRVAYENVLDVVHEGIDYAELRFSPWFMAEPHQLHPAGVVEAVIAGVDAARAETGALVNLIGILSRTYGVDTAYQELDSILQFSSHLVALDLAGDEANFPGGLFREHIDKARLAGLKITIHAGEAAGPASVWQAINELGASRIGHAVRALEDVELVKTIAERRIGIESNLTSNVQTSTVADYPSHPLKQFLELGCLATINTDDPVISNIDLRYEYEVAAPAAGLSVEQIHQAQRNALEVAFLSAQTKQSLLKRKAQS